MFAGRDVQRGASAYFGVTGVVHCQHGQAPFRRFQCRRASGFPGVRVQREPPGRTRQFRIQFRALHRGKARAVHGSFAVRRGDTRAKGRLRVGKSSEEAGIQFGRVAGQQRAQQAAIFIIAQRIADQRDPGAPLRKRNRRVTSFSANHLLRFQNGHVATRRREFVHAPDGVQADGSVYDEVVGRHKIRDTRYEIREPEEFTRISYLVSHSYSKCPAQRLRKACVSGAQSCSSLAASAPCSRAL